MSPVKTKDKSTTPLMQQYLGIKTRYPDEIVFFRLGDFYEMFYEDAVKAAPVLEVALTKRQNTPMCGVPHHAASGYMAKLLKAGFSVAMAEQLEDPKKTKGMVKRDVVRVITPGTIIEEELLSSKSHNFLVALSLRSGKLQQWALAVADVSTGRLWAGECKIDTHWNQLKSQLATLNPSELLIIGEHESSISDLFNLRAAVRMEKEPENESTLKSQVNTVLKSYLKRNHQQLNYDQVEFEPLPMESSGVMFLDESAVRHLELVDSADPLREGPTLFAVLDKTVTPMGSRLLRWWILHPSIQKQEIQGRLNQVGTFVGDLSNKERLHHELKGVSDLERISVRIQAGTLSPRDAASLRQSLALIPQIQEKLGHIMEKNASPYFQDMVANLNGFEPVLDHLKRVISDEPPAKLSDGGVIQSGVNEELDQLRDLRKSGRRWIAEMEAAEREKTGITNLKVGYNDVFGYFLEVSKSHLSKVPTEWIRKQTLANAERYITPALKEQEERILGAQEKILALEQKLFNECIHFLKPNTTLFSKIAETLARLDVVLSLATVASEQGYVRPDINDSQDIQIEGMRHPVVEKQIGLDRFIPNDVKLGKEDRRIAIITGPNMAGKSTFLRQTALNVIMAQMGSFVPAKKAQIGLVDRIFTRIGASDRLAQGQSTFMVEMNEVATLLSNSTAKSLVVLDEVGRGTSTYDGVSIAWAVVDFLAKPHGPRTLFATHYFELTQLAGQLENVKNLHATAKEWTGADGRRQVVFLYQIRSGAADRSYGIHVAEMAGVPDECITRAREILSQLESESHKISDRAPKTTSRGQLSFFSDHPVLEELKKLRPEQLTPLEALNELDKLKKKITE